MTKARETLSVHSTSRSRAELAGESPAAGREGTGVVRCFVEPDELRRLLALMAGAELVGVMLGDLCAG